MKKKHHTLWSFRNFEKQFDKHILNSIPGYAEFWWYGINLSKSFWVLMGWHWSKGKATLLPPELSPLSLQLTEGYNTDTKVTVPRISPFSSYRTLGVYISPSGCSNLAFRTLRGHAEDYASKFNTSVINRDDAFCSYFSYFIPKISFPLPVLSLSESQCSHLQSPALNVFLNKIHLNRNTARSIIHGPKEYGGLGIPHAYFLQSNGQLKLFIGHLRAQDKTAQLILISMSNLQLITGSSTPFLHLPYSQYSKWIP